MKTSAKRIFLMVSAVVSLAFGSATAHATFLNNGSGLTNPDQTLTFSEVSLPQGTSAATAYSSYGVSFSNLYSDYGYGYFPNNVTPDLVNWGNGSYLYGPFSVVFSHPVNDAAFVLVTNQSPVASIIQSFLNGSLVETASVFANTSNTNNYYGFTGSLFDKIVVSPETSFNSAALIDNLEFTSAAAPVPEPSTIALVGLGLAGVCLFRRRT